MAIPRSGWPFPSSDQLPQLRASRAAGDDAAAVAQKNDQAPFVVALELLDAIDVDDVRAVHAEERLVESPFELGERDAEQMRGPAHDGAHVIAFGPEVNDVADGDGHDARADAREESLERTAA